MYSKRDILEIFLSSENLTLLQKYDIINIEEKRERKEVFFLNNYSNFSYYNY